MLSIVLDPDDTKKNIKNIFVCIEFNYILREEEIVQ